MTVARSLISLLLLVVFTVPQATAVDNNLIAHKLYTEGKYARAAEIFTDPAWKGAALYRSSQWWRAAEAFVRADDAQSAFNLGNSYVKLGYYALALDAYQRALSIDSELEHAKVNADIVRQILALNDDESEPGGRQPSGDEIERLENEDAEDERQSGSGDGGEESDPTGNSAPERSNESGDASSLSGDKAETGAGGEVSDRKIKREGENGTGAVNGQEIEREEKSQPSGGSESDKPTDASQAAGLRAELENAQATERWLNRIEHDAQRYLAKRIEMEQRRRRAAGQSAPEGGNSW